MVIPGSPLPAPRAGRRGRLSFMPKTYLDHREAIAWAFLRFRGGHRPADVDDRFSVSAVFHRPTAGTVDVDNLLKTVLDAGLGVLWRDDSQVLEAHVRKALDRVEPRTWIRVYRIEAAHQEGLGLTLEAAKSRHPAGRRT